LFKISKLLTNIQDERSNKANSDLVLDFKISAGLDHSFIHTNYRVDSIDRPGVGFDLEDIDRNKSLSSRFSKKF